MLVIGGHQVNEREAQGRDVIAALRGFRDEIEHIMKMIEGKTSVTSEEKMHLQGLLKGLKRELKQAAKAGTVRGLKILGNDFERNYFAPAVSQAYADLNVAVNV